MWRALYRRRFTCNTNPPEAKEKRKQTLLDRYGTSDSLLINDGRERGIYKCNNDPEVQLKREQTNQERYGGLTSFHSECVQNKVKETLTNRYGSNSFFGSEHW